MHNNDNQMLEYLNQLMSNNNQEIYQLTDIEKAIISDSQADYEAGNVISNEEVIAQNEEWLKI